MSFAARRAVLLTSKCSLSEQLSKRSPSVADGCTGGHRRKARKARAGHTGTRPTGQRCSGRRWWAERASRRRRCPGRCPGRGSAARGPWGRSAGGGRSAAPPAGGPAAHGRRRGWPGPRGGGTMGLPLDPVSWNPALGGRQADAQSASRTSKATEPGDAEGIKDGNPHPPSHNSVTGDFISGLRQEALKYMWQQIP